MMSDTDSNRPPPITGTPESAAWFLAQLAHLGMTKGGYAKWLARRGDDRSPNAILRHVQRLAAGEARVSGETKVILALCAKAKPRRRSAGQPRRRSPANCPPDRPGLALRALVRQANSSG